MQTARIASSVLMDLLFDWKHGTDTMRWIDREALGARSDNLQHSCQYKATKARPFLRLLKELELPRDSNFVDIGAGKGRVLLIASRFGFRKVIGIEFSSPLCVLARKNVDRFSRREPLRSPIEVIEADASQHQFQAEDRVFFLFNPFDSFILARVLENIRRSLAEHPRRIWLIYNDPEHNPVVKAAGIFKTDAAYDVGGTHFQVYAN